ncbi:MAG: hypothetical protein MJY66_05215 [Bacteroidaceae bacterium]|nr:hypothetical protein [Bacteroidaceae bacterium]
MKHIEDLEELDSEVLERIAADSGITVPETLKQDIGATARILEAVTKPCSVLSAPADTGRRITLFSYAATAVALAAVLITVRPGTPKDTFDDPYLALAEFERTMNYIQDKTGAGLEFAGNKVEPVIEKTLNILK